uniref:Calcineurin-like phosphoesterase domain-containing protein n=1 Tax=Leersia perrieri TaxID=77586 RepID=A0A0D9VUX2_9ORYZ
MQSVTRLTLLLCSAWAAALLYGEMGAYWAARLSCSWPSSSPPSSPNNHVKIAVVADPQLMDSTSLGLPPSSIALQAAEFYTDLNMRRSFQSVILPFKPDVLLFLGDHFDGGPYMSNEEWHESLSRFKHIFSMNEHITNPNIPIHFLSGNHDIGYSAFHKIHPEVITRYEKEFGLRNYQFSAGKEPKKAKKDPLLGSSSEHYHQRVSNAAMDQGIIYQNYLSKETSDLLLSLLKPVLVLSGHDHDQCTIVHPTPFGPVTEHTLGTISWQQGNLYPSFMLLSAGSKLPENSTDIEREFVVTILLLVSWPTNGLRSLPYVNAFVSFMGSVAAELFSKTKEKDDEEDGEYEMVWDAEGSMHLVKKAVAKNPSTSSDSRTTGRGSVVARPTARKHQLEPDSSVLVEMSSEMTSEDGAKGSRSSKLKIRRVLQRLFRVIQSIVVIAALNVPLYMMLLFKDWIDR